MGCNGGGWAEGGWCVERELKGFRAGSGGRLGGFCGNCGADRCGGCLCVWGFCICGIGVVGGGFMCGMDMGAGGKGCSRGG